MEYVDLLEKATPDDVHLNAIQHGPGEVARFIVTPEVLAKAEKIFDDAEAAVAGRPDVLARVRTARAPVVFMKLHGRPPLQIGQGVYAPAGDAAYLERSDAFLASIPNQALQEHSAPWYQHHFFRQRIGGRLTTLENDRLRLDLVPALAGVAVRLTDKRTGNVLIRPEGVSATAGGLAESFAGSDFEVHPPIYRAESSSPKAVTLRGEMLYDKWAKRHPADSTRRIELDDAEPIVRLRSLATNRGKGAAEFTAALRADLAMCDPGEATVWILTPDGERKVVTFNSLGQARLDASETAGPAAEVWLGEGGSAVGLLVPPEKMNVLDLKFDVAQRKLEVRYAARPVTIGPEAEALLLGYALKVATTE